jgi:hypothetical protein
LSADDLSNCKCEFISKFSGVLGCEIKKKGLLVGTAAVYAGIAKEPKL